MLLTALHQRLGCQQRIHIAVHPCMHRYRPLLTPGFQRCRAQLPWWQIYGRGGEPIQAVTAPLPPQQEHEIATI